MYCLLFAVNMNIIQNYLKIKTYNVVFDWKMKLFVLFQHYFC
jgi:hypothetical protein